MPIISTFAIIFVAIFLFSFMLEKWLPAKEKPPLEKYDIQAIRKKFRKIEIGFLVSLFVTVPVFTFLLAKFLVFVQGLYLNLRGAEEVYLIGIAWWVFFIPSIWMSILLGGFMGDVILSFFGKRIATQEEFRVFYYDMNKRHAMGKEIDNKKFSLVFSAIAVSVFFIVGFLGIDSYTKITDDSLIHNRYFGIQEKEYRFDNVVKILHVKKYKNKLTGEIEPSSPHYAVLVRNGFLWETSALSINGTPREKEIIDFISQKSNISVEEGIRNVDDKL